MKREDLENGMIIEFKNKERAIVLKNVEVNCFYGKKDILKYKGSFDLLDEILDDNLNLTSKVKHKYEYEEISKIYKINCWGIEISKLFKENLNNYIVFESKGKK